MAKTNIQDQVTNVISGHAPWNSLFNVGTQQIQAMAALASNLYEQGQNRNAESIFQGLIALDDNSYYGYAGMGALALSEERLEEALSYLQKAAELQPKDPTVRANLGETLLRQARFREAAEQFEKALTLDPGEHDPGANRARAILEGMEVVLAEYQRMEPSAGVN
jgi:tetratricopeptide (TPR) repeat protein